MKCKYNVYQATQEIVSAIIRHRYSEPMVEQIQKAAIWFVSWQIPAHLRSEEAVWSNKNNFERIVRCVHRFCDLYDKGKVEIFHLRDENGIEILRCRLGKIWYTLETKNLHLLFGD